MSKEKVILGILTIIIIALAAANYKTDQFWEASLFNLVTLFVAGFVAYYLKEKKDDSKRADDYIEQVLKEIETLATSCETFIGTRQSCLSKQRICANKIEYLLKYLEGSDTPGILRDMQCVKEWFLDMRNLYSPDGQTMRNNEHEMERLRGLIATRCTKMRLALYTKKDVQI